MPKSTNLIEIKGMTKVLFDAVRIEPIYMGFVQHPFIEYYIVPFKKDDSDEFSYLDIMQEENYLLYRKWFFKQINNINDIFRLYMLVRDPWKLTWLKYTKEFMSSKDFAELLADAWVKEENPNGDVNVPIQTSISWFKKAKKKYLMSEEEYKVWDSLPDKLTVYRGVSPRRVALGLSWTSNKEKAEWFQHRFETNSEKGFLQKAYIEKKYVLAYFNSRGEEELVVDVLAIKDLIEVI